MLFNCRATVFSLSIHQVRFELRSYAQNDPLDFSGTHHHRHAQPAYMSNIHAANALSGNFLILMWI